MIPSNKSHAMTAALESLFGRSTAIVNETCVQPPFGCGGDASKFRDELSRKEFTVSGMCQACQDKVWGGGDA